jgi:hypothetical protein
MDLLINAVTGQITSHTKDGKVRQDHLDLLPDVSNGRVRLYALNTADGRSERRPPVQPPWIQDAGRDVHRKNDSTSVLDSPDLAHLVGENGRLWIACGHERYRLKNKSNQRTFQAVPNRS